MSRLVFAVAHVAAFLLVWPLFGLASKGGREVFDAPTGMRVRPVRVHLAIRQLARLGHCLDVYVPYSNDGEVLN